MLRAPPASVLTRFCDCVPNSSFRVPGRCKSFSMNMWVAVFVLPLSCRCLMIECSFSLSHFSVGRCNRSTNSIFSIRTEECSGRVWCGYCWRSSFTWGCSDFGKKLSQFCFWCPFVILILLLLVAGVEPVHEFKQGHVSGQRSSESECTNGIGWFIGAGNHKLSARTCYKTRQWPAVSCCCSH